MDETCKCTFCGLEILMTKHSNESEMGSSYAPCQPITTKPIESSSQRISSKRTHPDKAMSENGTNLVNEHYRNHLLNFIETEDLCIGEVFKDGERLAYCESVDVDSARQYCRQIIDEQLYEQNIANTNKAPNLADVIKAMLSIKNQIDERCQLLLTIHLKNENKIMQIDELKTLGKFHSTTDVFLRYAELARLLCDALAYLPSTQASGRDPFLNLVINSQEPDINASSGLSISLKPVIFEALQHISKL
jgi:hypothetical protein